MDNSLISNTILVGNPSVFLERGREGTSNTLSYLKVFIDAVYSAHGNMLEIKPEEMEKTADFLTNHARNTGYLAFTGYVCANIAKQIKNSSTLSLINTTLCQLSGVIFESLYGAGAIYNSYKLAKDLNFGELLKKDDDQVLQGLMQNLCRPISSNLDELKTSWEKLEPPLQESEKSKFKKKLQDAAKQTLALDQRKELFKHLQTPVEGIELLLGLTDQEYWQFTPLEAIGLVITQHKVRQRNWTDLKGLTSRDVANAVDSAYRKGLLERMHSNNPAVQAVAHIDMKQLVQRVRLEHSQTKRIHQALVIISLLGAIVSLIGLLSLPIGIGIAVTSMSCVVTASSVLLNMYLSKKTLLESAPNKYNRALIITAAILLGVSLLTFTGVTLVFGLSLVQLGIVLGIGGPLGVGFLGYQYYLLDKKDQLWKEAYPSVEVFQKKISEARLRNDGWNKGIHETFKKLPKDLRQALRHKYELEGSSDQYTLENEISAFKKTSKYFWKKWQISNLEEDRVLALEVQAVYDALLLSKEYAEELGRLETSMGGDESLWKKQLDKCRENTLLLEKARSAISRRKEVGKQLEKGLRYIVTREKSLSHLSQQIQEVSLLLNN